MQGPSIYEFNNVPLKANLLPIEVDEFGVVLPNQPGKAVMWESQRLTAEYPIEGRPKGADRGICKIVNGLASVNFIDKEILKGSRLELTASLCGEYAGISGIIQQVAFSQLYTPLITQMYASNGALGFPQLASFSNLTQNIFLRLVFKRIDTVGPTDPPGEAIPLNVLITGSLMALAPR